MQLNKAIRREIEVAFSKHAQPPGFRLVKYAVLFTALYFFRRKKAFWVSISVVIIVAVILHFWYRYKTRGWTKSYGLWRYEKNEPANIAGSLPHDAQQPDERLD